MLTGNIFSIYKILWFIVNQVSSGDNFIFTITYAA
jgi:hypothetical protein